MYDSLPSCMGFSRQEYWSGLPFLSPVDLPDPGIESGSPPFQADALTSQPLGNPEPPTFNLHANGLAITASRLHRYTLISQTRSVSLRSRGSRPHMLSAQASQSLTLHLIPASLCFSHPLKPFLPLSQRNSVLAAPQVCSLNLLTLLSISEMFNSIVDSPFVK